MGISAAETLERGLLQREYAVDATFFPIKRDSAQWKPINVALEVRRSGVEKA